MAKVKNLTGNEETLFTNALVCPGDGNEFVGAVLASPHKLRYTVGERDAWKVTEVFKWTPNSGSFKNEVDLSGQVLMPSFVDMHSHTEVYSYTHPLVPAKTNQGITAEIVGNCGISLYPFDESSRPYLLKSCQSIFGDAPEEISRLKSFTLSTFIKMMKERNVQSNLAFLQGHAALRFMALGGEATRSATASEIERMCSTLEQSFDEGAIGFSTGLYYSPCIFADKRELLSLLRVVRKHNGIFAIHRRQEGDDVLNATREAVELAQEAGVRLEVSHLKAIGDINQAKVSEMINIIAQAREGGLDVESDTYPYVYGTTSLDSMLPPRVLKMGRSVWQSKLKDPSFQAEVVDEMMNPQGWESFAHLVGWNNIFIGSADEHPQWNGRRLTDIALSEGMTEGQVFCTALSSPGVAMVKDICQTKESLNKMYREPFMHFCTDSLFAGSVWHPRSTDAVNELFTEFSRDFRLGRLVEIGTSESAERAGFGGHKIAKGSVTCLCAVEL